LCKNERLSYFSLSSEIWNSKVPPIVIGLDWSVAIGRIITCDLVQRMRHFVWFHFAGTFYVQLGRRVGIMFFSTALFVKNCVEAVLSRKIGTC
jgi:hypothetical protein